MVAQCWLRSDDDAKFAAAAMKCRHNGAFCIADGYCHYGGECFSRKRLEASLEERIERLESRITAMTEGN